jgi:hypothetical protein
MKINRLSNWKDDKSLDCMLFFALRIRELVFDYTLDTFKYPALNSTASCKEALDLIRDIEKENITSKALEPVIQELQWKIRKDLVVKSILGEDLKYYLNFGDIYNLKEIKIKLELLYNKIEPIRYCRIAEKLMGELIVGNKEKKVISQLATSYVSSLINQGFSQSYIYTAVNLHFFSSNKILDCNQIMDFFALFNKPKESYKVIIKCSNLLLELSSSAFAFTSRISETLLAEETALDQRNYLKSKRRNEVFFITEKIEAYDPISAKIIAERRINKLSKLFVFFHHKQHPDWCSKALIINEVSSNTFLLDERVSPMSKGRDLKPEKAAIKLNQLIRGLILHKESFAKYDRAIDLHGLAIENKYVENQLLQNWIAFETLLVGYSTKSKIDQVLDHLLPFLRFRYIERTIVEFSKDLMRFDQKFFSAQLKKIDIGNNINEKIAALITFDKYKTNRDEIYNHLEKSPLLKWRLSLFNKYFGSPNEVQEFIATHDLKINWQIRRMYRTRNLIVHAGRVPDFTEILVENSHNYLDLLVGTINEFSINGNIIRSIEQTIEEVSILNLKHEHLIKANKDKNLNENNFTQVLFGY